jgi:hypothetical protein
MRSFSPPRNEPYIRNSFLGNMWREKPPDDPGFYKEYGEKPGSSFLFVEGKPPRGSWLFTILYVPRVRPKAWI